MGSSTTSCALGKYEFVGDTVDQETGETIQYVFTKFEVTDDVIKGINKVCQRIEGAVGCQQPDNPGPTLQIILDPGTDPTIAYNVMKAYAQFLEDINSGRRLPVEPAMAVYAEMRSHG